MNVTFKGSGPGSEINDLVIYFDLVISVYKIRINHSNYCIIAHCIIDRIFSLIEFLVT